MSTGRSALGMRRLAIIDLEGGDQPIYNEDGAVVRRLQRRDLQLPRAARRAARRAATGFAQRERHRGDRPPLRGARGRLRRAACAGCSRSRSGTARSGELLLARDRVGKKPLFYALRGGVAALRLRAARDPAGPGGAARRRPRRDRRLPRQPVRAARPAARSRRCASCRRRTRCAGAPAASRASSATGGSSTRPKAVSARARRPSGCARRSSRRRGCACRSDVPLGAFLSGGVDSSVVVAAMAQSSAEPVRPSRRVPRHERFDETAARARGRRALRHRATRSCRSSPRPRVLPRIAWHFGEPFADPAALPTLPARRADARGT